MTRAEDGHRLPEVKRLWLEAIRKAHSYRSFSVTDVLRHHHHNQQEAANDHTTHYSHSMIWGLRAQIRVTEDGHP
jgi:hypothetical protein